MINASIQRITGRNNFSRGKRTVRPDAVTRAIYFIPTLFFLTIGTAMGDTSMKITSPDFEPNGSIPKKFTCQGEDVNPALLIEGVPQQAKTLALIMDDPDAPMGTWVHWVVYNIPVTSKIEENSVPGEQGSNNFGKQDYGGPCPPSGTHRYFFKLYALDARLDLQGKVDKKALERALEGHILDKAEIIGMYKK